jgi:hypothetical protein
MGLKHEKQYRKTSVFCSYPIMAHAPPATLLIQIRIQNSNLKELCPLNSCHRGRYWQCANFATRMGASHRALT